MKHCARSAVRKLFSKVTWTSASLRLLLQSQQRQMKEKSSEFAEAATANDDLSETIPAKAESAPEPAPAAEIPSFLEALNLAQIVGEEEVEMVDAPEEPVPAVFEEPRKNQQSQMSKTCPQKRTAKPPKPASWNSYPGWKTIKLRRLRSQLLS